MKIPYSCPSLVRLLEILSSIDVPDEQEPLLDEARALVERVRAINHALRTIAVPPRRAGRGE